MLDVVALDLLIKSRVLVIPSNIQAQAYTFGWCLANVVFKHTLAVVFTEKGDEADFDEYFSAFEVLFSLVFSS
jgi:hypothetical protein